MQAKPCNIIWCGNIHIGDIVLRTPQGGLVGGLSGSSVSSQILERQQQLIDIFQTISGGGIHKPVEKNFYWEWVKNWLVVVFNTVKDAQTVKDAFDTFIVKGDKFEQKQLKQRRAEYLRSIFPKGIDWGSFIVDFKTPKSKDFRKDSVVVAAATAATAATTSTTSATSAAMASTTSALASTPQLAQPIPSLSPPLSLPLSLPLSSSSSSMLPEVMQASKVDVGLSLEASNNIIVNPNFHKRKFLAKSATQKSSDAAKVGHANANSPSSWQIMESDGSNVNIAQRHRDAGKFETMDDEPKMPTVVSLLECPTHRVAIMKFDLLLKTPCLISVVPIVSGNSGDTTPDLTPAMCKKYTQNTIV